MSNFNENTRVQLPAILHLTRLGFEYLSLKGANWDESTNIFPDIFSKSLLRINPSLKQVDCDRLLSEISLELENEDLGRAFFKRLVSESGARLIDFENFDNNSFHVVTELPCKKDEDSFRPDITLLINGMPLFFIEVKPPNNLGGVRKEHDRMAVRFQNKKFRKFINITQLMVFSNNMEYDDTATVPLQGAYYSSTSYYKPVFNYFREEEQIDLKTVLEELTDAKLDSVLRDANKIALKGNQEFNTNLDPNTPTNRICTSLFQKDRIIFLLKYAFAYVHKEGDVQKHVMRYPQLFATKAITEKLDTGLTKGIIWHTQGSGKTALAFYNVKHLTDYYQKKGVIPKFYFIVDRLDLLKQASREFRSRGLTVHNIDSRDDFVKDIKSSVVIHNDSGNSEITVVNIQKFQDDPSVARNTDYNLGIRRIYFLDEVHRSYNPKGSFLSNLNESDSNAIKIGLTGTPLLKSEYTSKSLFGDYIHKYYYNSSIKDGYTLRLIREDIETSYRLKLAAALEDVPILKGDSDKRYVYSHQKFVEPMLDYIVSDFERSRISMNDNSVGAMVICDSADQAKKMNEIFEAKYKSQQNTQDLIQAAEPKQRYALQQSLDRKVNTAALILHDVGTKEDRDEWTLQFKEGKIDILFVFNMLLTGFDAPRLKKLYVGRMIKAHNLLQALTRVNRTYKEFKFGYVVDFAGIEDQFKKTSEDYFRELQSELGDELQSYSDLFLTEQETEQKIDEIKDVLLWYDTDNKAEFSRQISQITERSKMLEITRALNEAKSLYNLIRLSGNHELLNKLDFKNLAALSREANGHLALINTKENLEQGVDTNNLLNVALEDVVFAFSKVNEEEMILADKLRDTLRKARESLANNFDKRDPEFISLKEELERIFNKKNLTDMGLELIDQNIKELDSVYGKAVELQRKNSLLQAKYENDEKYARLHKRLMEKDPLTESESKLFEALSNLKHEVDSEILRNTKMMDNEGYVEQLMLKLVAQNIMKPFKISPARTKSINSILLKEYMNEYHGKVA